MYEIRFCVVDDFPALRAGVCSVLESKGFQCVGQFSTLAEVEPLVRQGGAEILILDVQLPDGDGITQLQQWRQEGVAVPVLIKSMLPEESSAARAFKAGANGYFHKGGEIDELVKAVTTIVRGGRYVSPEYAAFLAETLSVGKPALPHEALSEKQLQVLCEIGRGRSPAEIAEIVGCSINTLSSYRARILKKLGLSTTAELVQYVYRHKLIAYSF